MSKLSPESIDLLSSGIQDIHNRAVATTVHTLNPKVSIYYFMYIL